MFVLADTGASVVPGEVLFAEPADSIQVSSDAVVPGKGTYARLVDSSTGSGVEWQILSLLLGVAQWDGAVVSVHPRRSSVTSASQSSTGADIVGSSGMVAGGNGSLATEALQVTSIFGPRPGDLVHLRVSRVTRLSAAGEIIAINGSWCSGSATLGKQEAFRGVIRVEDIRPFKPTKDQLQPPPPSQAFQAGDVVLAEVISQSDVRQYQLSTMANRCGVLESTVTVGDYGSENRCRLEHLPGRRDAMVCPVGGAVHYRWTPLIDC